MNCLVSSTIELGIICATQVVHKSKRQHLRHASPCQGAVQRPRPAVAWQNGCSIIGRRQEQIRRKPEQRSVPCARSQARQQRDQHAPASPATTTTTATAATSGDETSLEASRHDERVERVEARPKREGSVRHDRGHSLASGRGDEGVPAEPGEAEP